VGPPTRTGSSSNSRHDGLSSRNRSRSAWPGRAARAARLFGAADAQRRARGAARVPPDRPAYGRDLAVVRTALGEDRFAAGWTAGQTLRWEQTVALAESALAATSGKAARPARRREGNWSTHAAPARGGDPGRPGADKSRDRRAAQGHRTCRGPPPSNTSRLNWAPAHALKSPSRQGGSGSGGRRCTPTGATPGSRRSPTTTTR
jgi:hypothetical protein